METIKSSQKLIFVLIFLCSALLLTGCSKDEDEKTEPTNGNGGTKTAKTIGSSGGEITFDDLTITIPPGAFTGDQVLELSVSEKLHPFSEQEVTDLYEIKGIPETYSGSVSLAMKYRGKLEDESYIAHRFSDASEESDSGNVFFDLLECVDSSGYLVGKLYPVSDNLITQAAQNNLKSQQFNPLLRLIMGVTKYETFQDPDYTFTIRYPNYLGSDPRITELPDDLELDYLIFQPLIAGTDFEKLFPKKVQVYDMRGLNPKYYNAFTYNKRSTGNNKPGIPFNTYFIYHVLKTSIDKKQFDIEVGKSFYKLYQRYTYGLKPGPDWFSRAAYVWIDELFYDPFGTLGDYFPDVLTGNELDCFSGWGRNDNDVMVPIVKYMTDHVGLKAIGDYHDLILKDHSMYEAMDLTIYKVPRDWIPLFFKEYVAGRIYSITGDVFVRGIDGQEDLPAHGTQRVFEREYNDLSAKIFRFNTDNVDLTENAKVAFGVESYDVDKKLLSVLIFSLNRVNNEIEFESEFSDEVKILSNIKDLQDQNKDLLAVVMNLNNDVDNASNTSSISLKVETRDVTSLNYRRFTVRLGKVDVRSTYLDMSTKDHENATLELYMPFNEFGSFTGNTFDAGWKIPDGNASDSGFAKAVVVDEEQGIMLKSFEYQKIYTYDFESTKHLKGSNIKLELQSTEQRLYAKLQGNELSNAYEIIDWAVRYYNADGTLRDGTFTKSIIGTNSDSYLEVIFSDPEFP